ncbi:MAG: RNA methyltransferase, partial [Clostridia bacterium]|nr:RNA methyltransferase [Clostridia bacterium]
DPGNVGTVIRTAAALGIKSVYLIDCADAYSPKCVRSSMCGIYFVDIYALSYEEAENIFDGADLFIADMGGENVFDMKAEDDFCLVIGSESHGVSNFFRERAKKTIAIPMSANMESLNAAISCSKILYQLLKKPII